MVRGQGPRRLRGTRIRVHTSMSSPEVDTASTTTSFQAASLDYHQRAEQDNLGTTGQGASSSLLNAELSAMITLLRRQMSGARFFSDTRSVADLLDEFGKARTKTVDPRSTRLSHVAISLPSPSIDRMTCAEGLEPFIVLFRSVDTTGQIVMGALESVRRLLLSGYFPALPDCIKGYSFSLVTNLRTIDKEDVEAFRALLDAIAKCRFEATDLNMDEIALMKLTCVLLDALRHPLGASLSDGEVCTAVETIFRLCFQTRFSEMLRQASCYNAITAVHILFSHLGRLVKDPVDLVKVKPIALPLAKVSEGVETPSMEAAREESNVVLVNSPPVSTASYGVSTLIEVLRFLARLLDGQRLDDRGRCLAAEAIGTVIELTRDQIDRCKPLFSVLSGEVCRNLIALASMNSTGQVLRQVMHPLAGLFRLYRRILPSQFGHLLSRMIEEIVAKPAPNSKQLAKFYETKAILMEILLEFVEDGSLVCDLFVYYECDQRYSMLLSELVTSLCDLVSVTGSGETCSMLAMQMLNRMVYELAYHAKEFKMDGGASILPSPTSSEGQDYAERRRMKTIMSEAVALYNQKPKDAFAFLIRQGLMSEEPTAAELAKFLRRTPGLDKRTMGEYLAKEGNEPIVRAFMSDFCFQPGETIDVSIRKVLESFRLPGEAQMIDRVVEAFAEVYFESVGRESGYASLDATHILSFSIIMLNTDLYNPQNQRRMTLEEFIRNNRGINDGVDFDHNLLRHIYKTIAEKEIVMPEEVEGEAHAWKEVLIRADGYAHGLDSLPSLPQLLPSHYLAGIFGLIFPSLLACYLPSSGTSRPEDLTMRSFAGIRMMAQVLSDLELHPLMAELIEALWQATGIPDNTREPRSSVSSPKLNAGAASSPPAQMPMGSVKARTIRHISRSDECRLTLQTLFEIIQAGGPNLRAGWRTFVTALFAFAESGLLHLEMVDPKLEEEIRRATSLTVKPGTPFDGSVDDGSNRSLFSAFSSYIVSSNQQGMDAGSPGDEPVDPEAKRRALRVIREACQLDKILQDTRYFQRDSLHALLQALSQGLLFSTSSGSTSEHSLVILLELLVYVAWQNRERLAEFWPTLSACLADLSKLPLRSLCEHSSMGLGRICLWLCEYSTTPETLKLAQEAPTLYFQVLCHVSPETFQYIAEPAMSLALQIVEASRSRLAGCTAIWPHYFTLLSRSSRLRACDPSTFGLLRSLTPKDGEDILLLPLDFFSEFLDLLGAFIGNSVEVPSDRVTHISLASKDSLRPPPSEASSPKTNSLTLALGCLEGLPEFHKRLLTEDWAKYILPFHSELAKLCSHPSRLLRQHVLSLLQRLILSLDFVDSSALQSEFTMVLIPMLNSLAAASDIPQAEETQMRASSILCKIWLQNLPVLSASPSYLPLWKSMLQALLDLLQGRSDILRESIPESIKNMLLVMATVDTVAGVDSSAAFWAETWAMLDPVIPRLHQDFASLTAPDVQQEAVVVVEKTEDASSNSSSESSGDEKKPAVDLESSSESEEEVAPILEAVSEPSGPTESPVQEPFKDSEDRPDLFPRAETPDEEQSGEPVVDPETPIENRPTTLFEV